MPFANHNETKKSIFSCSIFRPRNGTKKEFYVLDSREVAPLAADKYMFVNTTASPSEGKHGTSDSIKGFHVLFRTLEKT